MSLPNGSTIRNDLSGSFINTLWTTLQHPPISYLGNEFRFRTADGSNNVGLLKVDSNLSGELRDELTSIL